MRKSGTRVTIPVAQIEFCERGNTIWIHGPNGETVLRIKVGGRVTSRRCQAAFSHADAVIDGDVDFCVARSR